MKLELHHFFILVEPGGNPGEQLLALGFEEGKARTHPGQGTSNRRFYLTVGMVLELLWVHDVKESSTGPAARLQFSDRVNNGTANRATNQAANQTANSHASPFGLIFCPAEKLKQGDDIVPFSGWSYQPDYFKPPMAFHVGENSEILIEPLCIYAPFFEPADRELGVGKFSSLKKIKITVPSDKLSSVLERVNNIPGLSIELGHEHLMELFFERLNDDAGNVDEVSNIDLRPILPLIIYC